MDYVHKGGEFIKQGLLEEHQGNFVAAHNAFQQGISILLEGGRKDTNVRRSQAVRNHLGQYLDHLENLSLKLNAQCGTHSSSGMATDETSEKYFETTQPSPSAGLQSQENRNSAHGMNCTNAISHSNNSYRLLEHSSEHNNKLSSEKTLIQQSKAEKVSIGEDSVDQLLARGKKLSHNVRVLIEDSALDLKQDVSDINEEGTLMRKEILQPLQDLFPLEEGTNE
eukprot:gene5839-9042_t